jgi:hypothetical protein
MLWCDYLARYGSHGDALAAASGASSAALVADAAVAEFSYPVLTYPEKVRAINLDKTPQAVGILVGIKGQYLMFDGGVLNVRKYGGYEVSIEI